MNVARDPACVSASRRRRDRRLRSLWHHECMAVRMALATAAHHSSQRVSCASTQTEYVAGPAPVTEYVAPAPAVFDAATVPVTYHEAFPRVVGSLPPFEVVSAPVFDQVRQEQLAAGEIRENMVVIPVFREQVIVQAILRVVGSLPPVAEFTEALYNPIHQEQFSAGETLEASERKCPRSCCCFAWGRTVSGTGCH